MRKRQSVALPDHRKALLRINSTSSETSFVIKQLKSQHSFVLDDNQLKCLIANDETLQLNILESMFSNQNFQVMTARNGHEAFELVQKKFKESHMSFDLVVLDLNMPIADGYEAIKNINSLYANPNIFNFKDQA